MWELGLRYSSSLHLSNRGGPSCLLQSGGSSPEDSAGCTDRKARATSDSDSGAGRLVEGSN